MVLRILIAVFSLLEEIVEAQKYVEAGQKVGKEKSLDNDFLASFRKKQGPAGG